MENRFFRLKRLKAQVKLFSPVLFLLAAVLLIGVGVSRNPTVVSLRQAGAFYVAPVVDFIVRPVSWVQAGWGRGKDFLNTYRENQRLIAENHDLRRWRTTALQLAMEQRRLKELLNYAPPPKAFALTARVLADNGGSFSHSLIVQAGARDGLKKGAVALTENGVFGRVVEVGASSCRLMLLTDYLSRVPVSVGEAEIPAILSGDSTPFPKLISLPENVLIQAGDLVLTSGRVGVYPAGLAIGFVAEAARGEISVRLFESGRALTFVRLVDFGLSQVLLAEDACANRENP